MSNRTMAALGVALILLAFMHGCPGLDQTGQADTGGIKVKPVLPKPNAPGSNFTGTPDNSSTNWNGNHNGSGSTTNGNGTPPAPNKTNPRNISDNIGDGEFDILDFRASPLKVYVIDCGNADCILINKGLFNMLIDAGNATPVMKQLSKMKVNRLNIVVATKDSPDAIAGLGDILDSNDVDEFWYSGITPRTQQLKDAITRIKAREIPIKHPHRGDTASIAGIDFYALNPEKQFYNGAPEADAVVLKISSGNFCMLLLNPTNQEKENAFIGLNESMDCQVATYFNHGEGRAQASLFIKDYVKPDDVIISAGNTDGLPSSTILTYMSIYGIDTWVTGTNGTIEVIGDTSGTYSISASKNSTG